MTDKALRPAGGIDPSRLNRDDYANSLAEEAVRAGLMHAEDLERIRLDMMNVLAEAIGYATEGKSTNVTTERARSLSRSILYNIGAYLRTCPSPEAAALELKERRMSELYGKGYLINRRKWEEAKRLWAKARYSRLRDEDEGLGTILDRNFRIYLSAYDPRISAHDKIYLSLPRYGIRGAFHIGGAVNVLKRLLEIGGEHPSNTADFIERPAGADPTEKSEPSS